MGFERGVSGVDGDGGGAWAKFVAGDKDVVVGGAAAFGGDDVGEVGFCDFIDNTDEAFVPARFVIVWGSFL